MKMKKFFALLLCILCLMSIAAPVYATDAKALARADGYTVCEENTDVLSRVGVSAASAQENAWAALRMNANRTGGTLLLRYGNFTYNVSLSGYVEEAADGYIGHYQGWFSPNSQDSTFYPMLYKEETALLASVNATFYQNDVFFTLVIGYIGDGCTPVTMAFGERSNGINAATASYTAAMKQQRETIAPVNNASEPGYAKSERIVDASIVFQDMKSITVSGSSMEFGQLSLFHTDTLGNQNSTPVRVKVNTNAPNANTYAISYFGINTSNVTMTTYPSGISMRIVSSHNWLTVQNYEPVSGTATLSIPIPYVSGIQGTGSDAKAIWDLTTLTFYISSVNATLSTDRTDINWAMSKAGGFSNTGGAYSGEKGMVGLAYFRSDTNLSNGSKTGRFTTTGRISYETVTEDNTFLTQNYYTFTTATATISSSLQVVA